MEFRKIETTRLSVSSSVLKSSPSLRGNQQKSYDRVTRTFKKYDFSSSSLEGLTECVVDSVLNFMCVNDEHVKHVHYKAFADGDERGCISTNFVGVGEREVTVTSIIGRMLIESSFDSLDVKGQIGSIIAICKCYTRCMSLEQFFGVQFLLDYLFLNEDRHLSNVSFIKTTSGNFITAPYFDYGASFRFCDLLNISKSFMTFEPQPLMQEQLMCIDDLLGGAKLKFHFNKWENCIAADKLSEWGRVYTKDEIELTLARFKACLEYFPRKDRLEIVL